jgi:hypothetical protein
MKKAISFFICLVILASTSCNQHRKTWDATGRFLINQNGKYGYIDKKGRIVINPQFDLALEFSEGLARVRVEIGGKQGYIDKSGKIVINPQFDLADEFSQGLAPVLVQLGDKWGYIDKKGKMIIDPQFDDVGLRGFSEGLAPVKIDGKWGYIDKKGRVVIKPQFDWAWWFSEGMAEVEIDDKWGYIDNTGNIVVNPQFDGAYAFSEGLARVYIGGKTFLGTEGGTWGYIDKTGKYVWNLTTGISEDFSTAQKTLATMMTAAKKGDIDKFLDCWDLEYFRKLALAQFPNAEITEETIKAVIKTTPSIKNLIDTFKEYEISLLCEKDIGINARELTVRFIPKTGTGFLQSEEGKLILVKRGEKWKLNLETSFGF